MKKSIGIFVVIIALGSLLAVAIPFLGCELQEWPEDRWPHFRNDLTNTGYSTSGAVKDADAEHVKWTYDDIDDIISTCPAVRYDQVYVGSEGGIIYCFEKDKGGLVWKYPTTGAIGAILSSPAVAGHKVFVGR